jgi:hypothetical protein
MNGSISRGLQITFLVHAAITAVLGLGLWLIPGRSLSFVGWVPSEVQIPDTDITAPGTIFVDPLVTRLLGSVLLALALSSFQGWRIRRWSEVALLVQLEAAFSFLSVIAFLVVGLFLQRARVSTATWVVVIYLVAFGIVWLVALRRH